MRSERYREHDLPLSRDPDRACLGGVCAGLARFLGVAPLLVRIGTVLALLMLPQTMLLGYGLAYFILDPVRGRRERRDDWDSYD